MKLNPDYLGREQCESVKGIFILLVFFSHFMGYVRQTGGVAFDMPLGQLIVTLFLFYSGYGVMESIRTKGAAYVREMPKRRILTTLLNFDIAVLAFIGVDLLLGQSLTAKQCLLSLVAWDSVGNSNWYIFVILLCYVAAWMTRDALKCHERVSGKTPGLGGVVGMVSVMVTVAVFSTFSIALKSVL